MPRRETAMTVIAIGQGGWVYADNRAVGYLDENGANQLIASRSTVERALVEERVEIVAPGPEGAPGAVHFRTEQDEDKATIKNLDIQIPFLNDGIGFAYRWYRVAGGPNAAPSLKTFIENPDEPNRTDLQALDRGYTDFNYELIYEPYRQCPVDDNVWTDEVIDYDTGGWWLRTMTPDGGVLGDMSRSDQAPLLTLQKWAKVFRDRGVTSAMYVGAMLGVGSYNPGQDSYVQRFEITSDGFETSRTFHFGGPAPTP